LYELIISKIKLMGTKLETLNKCWKIKSKNNYSYWNNLIIVSAIQVDCGTFFTEDLQHN